MQPLVRNVGEAMGVTAKSTSPRRRKRDALAAASPSTTSLDRRPAGRTRTAAGQVFTGLNAPAWPDGFPPIDKRQGRQGRRTVQGNLQPLPSAGVDAGYCPRQSKDADFWSKFTPITWKAQGGQARPRRIGPARQYRSAKRNRHRSGPGRGAGDSRKVNTAGRDLARAGEFSPGLGLNVHVCQRLPTTRMTIWRVSESCHHPHQRSRDAALCAGARRHRANGHQRMVPLHQIGRTRA